MEITKETEKDDIKYNKMQRYAEETIQCKHKSKMKSAFNYIKKLDNQSEQEMTGAQRATNDEKELEDELKQIGKCEKCGLLLTPDMVRYFYAQKKTK